MYLAKVYVNFQLQLYYILSLHTNITLYIHRVYKTPDLPMTKTDQVIPGGSYDPLLMSLVKSYSISVDEGETD